MRALPLLVPVLLLVGGAAPLRAQTHEMGGGTFWMIAFDELELLASPEERPVEFDGLAWIGGDETRIWLKAEGERSTREDEGELEAHLRYGRVISPFFDALAGVGLDTRWAEGESRTRGLAGLTLQGLAPYWFELETTLFVSHEGDVSARFEAGYDLLLTQRLVIEPEVEVEFAVQEVPEFGVGTGLNAVEAGVRLRYEIVREFAPYVGLVRHRLVGGAADLARERGADTRESSFVAGVRWWY